MKTLTPGVVAPWEHRHWGVVGGPALGRIAPASGGGSGGQGQFNTVIDPSGSCEGGSCVNIIDRW